MDELKEYLDNRIDRLKILEERVTLKLRHLQLSKKERTYYLVFKAEATARKCELEAAQTRLKTILNKS